MSKFANLILSTVAALALASGCGQTSGDPERGGDRVGKGDDLGSCSAEGSDLCGGEGSGGCWCDDQCESYGDCCPDKGPICDGESYLPAPTGDLRIATYNLEDVRSEDLLDPDNKRLSTLASVIQAIQPDIILINEITYDQPGDPGYVDGEPVGQNGQRFADDFLAVAQRAELAGIEYDAIMFETNTGIPSGFDLDNNGRIVTEISDDIMEQRAYGGDCWGFGTYPGQYGFAVLVRPEITIDADDARTFRELLWSSMPDALAPVDPGSQEPWYSDEEWAEFRLSSKNHVDLPVILPGGERVHLLVSHPTPPAFDGPEGRNQRRNHDEIRLWADYLDGADYLVDDSGAGGGLPDGEHFVIMGDQNADPDEGASIDDPIGSFLLSHPRINGDFVPVAQAGTEEQFPELDADDTAQFRARVDYVLPSTTTEILTGGVVRPLWDEVGQLTDHFPVWLDLDLTP